MTTDWLTFAMLADLLGLRRHAVEGYAAKEDGIPRHGHTYERRAATPEDIARLGCRGNTQWVVRATFVGETKRCRRCREVQPLSQYGPSAQTQDGLASICRGCDGRTKGRISVTAAPKEKGCDACGGVLSRNRTTKLDGRLLCHPCWREVFA